MTFLVPKLQFGNSEGTILSLLFFVSFVIFVDPVFFLTDIVLTVQ